MSTPVSGGERRYSDEEFGVILRAASEVEKSPAPITPRDGLTLREIQEIAREVGLDPRRVARAAALLPSQRLGAIHALVGGAPQFRLEHEVAGTVPARELGRRIDVARRFFSTQGEAREVMGGVEWKGGTATSSVSVTILPRDDGTAIQASTDRSEALAGIYGGVALPVGGVIAVVLGKLVFGETDAGIVAALVSGMAPALLLARGLWKRSTETWRSRLAELMDALSREAERTTDQKVDES